MPFTPVQSEKLAAAVVRQVEQLILRGILRPGERLPPERDLSERLGVSRPSLRDAVAELHARGLLESRAGSGVYVATDLEARFPPAMTRLLSTHDDAVRDYLVFRRDIEGLAVARAAEFGSDTDLRVIDAVFGRMEAAHGAPDATAEAALDAQFHMAIIEASHNVVMLHIMRSMFGLLKEGVFFNRQVMFRQRMTREMLLAQHRAINEALQGRDADGARRAMSLHLDYVQEALDGQRRADRNEAVARKRFEHDRSR